MESGSRVSGRRSRNDTLLSVGGLDLRGQGRVLCAAAALVTWQAGKVRSGKRVSRSDSGGHAFPSQGVVLLSPPGRGQGGAPTAQGVGMVHEAEKSRQEMQVACFLNYHSANVIYICVGYLSMIFCAKW